MEDVGDPSSAGAVAFPNEEAARQETETVKCRRSLPGQTLTCAVSPPTPAADGALSQLCREDIVIRYGLHSVQGQRSEMEDDHKCVHMGFAEPQTPGHPVADDTDGITFEGITAEDDHYRPPPDTSFFGVYDGHAGTAAAHFLRTHLHRAILGHPQLLADPQQAAREGIAEVERRFIQYADSQRLDAGSTLAVILIVGTQLVAANVGDSEVVLNRGGQPVVLTTIHNMLKNPREEERVRECGGRVHHKRLGHPRYNPQFFSIAVTRSIGDLFFKQCGEGQESGLIAEADTCSMQLTHEDRFVIVGCDGLWDVMSYQQAIDFAAAGLAAGQSCQEVTEGLVQRALALGSTDNITALLVTLR